MNILYSLMITATTLTGSIFAGGTPTEQMIKGLGEEANVIQAQMRESTAQAREALVKANDAMDVDAFINAAEAYVKVWVPGLKIARTTPPADKALVVAASLGYLNMLNKLITEKNADPKTTDNLAAAYAVDPAVIARLTALGAR